MYDYHVVLGGVTLVLGLAAYSLYFVSIFRRRTKPHALTWTTYAINDGVVAAAQILKGAGPGAWPTVLSAVANGIIVLLAFWYGEKRMTRIDWVSFLMALLGIVFWILTNNALTAVLIASVVNVLGIIPTFRKAYVKPHEESISVWAIDIGRFGIALGAIISFSPTTALFPIVIVMTNLALVVMILVRRRQLAKLKS